MRLRTVGEVSELTGVTVRTLHHYHQIRVLEPSERTAAGYRLYSDDDLVRLHSILSWREMGFGLADIADMLDAPEQDLATGLKRQRERLEEQSERLESMIVALDAAIATIDRGDQMTDSDVRNIFDRFDPSRHELEVRERWGDTDSYSESRRRVETYGADDWRRQRTESDENVAAFVDLLRSGVPADDPRATDAARVHGAIIDRWFYRLTPRAHLGLAQMYVTDPRFGAVYEEAASGLARYISDAIQALHSN